MTDDLKELLTDVVERQVLRRAQRRKAAAEALVADDPYTSAGLFEHVSITGFRPVLGH